MTPYHGSTALLSSKIPEQVPPEAAMRPLILRKRGFFGKINYSADQLRQIQQAECLSTRMILEI